MAVGVDHRAKKVASRSDHSLLLQPVSSAMSFHPLTQTSEVPYPIPETTIFQDADDHSDYNSTSLDHPVGHSSSHYIHHKKRRQSRDKIATALRRSSSTPHMHNLALANAGDLSPTDKRRNKLGYHRTSVACGHCRRRKIRCLVAQDEPTGRCANCIRLKKECNFYPVDQAPEPQRLQANSGKDASSGATDSATSSPQHAPSLSGDKIKIDDFRPPFAPAVQPNPGHPYGLTDDSKIDSHHLPQTNTLHMPQPSYGYPQSIDTQWPPATTFLPSSSVAESPGSSSGYNLSGGQTPATMSSTSTMSYGAHPEGHNWPPTPAYQPPTRSMSYGNIEGLPHHFSNQGLGGLQQHEYPRRTSPYHYPGTIDTNSSITHTTMGCNSTAPLSAPIISSHNQYSYPPPWSYGGTTSGQDRSMSAQWYGEPGQLDQVQEEVAPVAYSQHALPQFYSGT